MRIHLHIGAHKTATTYVQSRLWQEREALGSHGVAIAPHADVRRLASNRLDSAEALRGAAFGLAARAASRGLRRIIETAGAADTLIVSDENLAGPIATVEQDCGMYPNVGRRTEALLRGLDGHEATVFLSVRAYPSFFDSVYAYRAGQRRAPPPEEYARQAASPPRDWLAVVADVVKAAGADRVTVWTFDGFLRAPQPVADALTGTEGLALFSATDRPRLPSLTSKGLALMDRVSDLLSDGEHARFARMVARFPFDQPDGRATTLAPETAERLAARYARDLDAIRAMGCRLIEAD